MEMMERSFQDFMRCIIAQPENYYELVMGILEADGLRIVDFTAQTEEMGLVAVKQNPNALKYVQNPTEAIYSAAVESAVDAVLDSYTFFDTEEGRKAVEASGMDYSAIMGASEILANALNGEHPAVQSQQDAEPNIEVDDNTEDSVELYAEGSQNPFSAEDTVAE